MAASPVPLTVAPQLWVGPRRPAEVKVRWDRPPDLSSKPRFRPWTSTYISPKFGSAWVQFCLRTGTDGGRDPKKLWKSWLLTVDESSPPSVYVVNSADDLVRLVQAYPVNEATRPDLRLDGREADAARYPDWNAVGRVYDAVHLTKRGQRATATRVAGKPDLVGWDCESTVWFKWVFSSIEYRGRFRYRRARRSPGAVTGSATTAAAADPVPPAAA
jgi:hypothetical protein